MHFLFTVNDNFMLPAKLCIQSLLKYCDNSNISSIIINDTGLSESNKEKLKLLYSSVEFISAGNTISHHTGLHSKEWLTVVASKTAALKACIEKNLLPVIMLDCDQFILSDFTNEISPKASCILCKRTQPAERSDGIRLNYIGSFFGAMDKTSIHFVNKWIDRINKLESSQMAPPYETPALCEIANEFLNTDKNTDIDFIEDEIISSPNKYIPNKTIIYHYKSEGETETTGNIVLDRSATMEQQLPKHFIKFLIDNLDSTDLFSISNSHLHAIRREWKPPNFIIDKARNLSDLSVIFRSDKGPLKHNYTDHYENLLERYRHSDCSLLEIGVANGSSLKMWSRFLKSSYIHGVDIDPACRELCAEWLNIKIHIGDAKSIEFDRKFDVIIDDGSHISKDIYKNFINLWRFVSPGGMYIVEDTYCTFTLSQSKYNPFRSIRDYRRGAFLRFIDLVLWNLDQRKQPKTIASVVVYPEFICITKTGDGNAELLMEREPQYSVRGLFGVLKAMVKNIT